MLDFILFIAVVMIFLTGVQLGAMFGGVTGILRKGVDWLESKMHKKDPPL